MGLEGTLVRPGRLPSSFIDDNGLFASGSRSNKELILNTIALQDSLGGGGIFPTRTQNNALGGFSRLKIKDVKLVRGMLQGFPDIGQIAYLSTVDLFQNLIALFLVSDVVRVGQNLRKNDDGWLVLRGFVRCGEMGRDVPNPNPSAVNRDTSTVGTPDRPGSNTPVADRKRQRGRPTGRTHISADDR